jgi:hypothetical protein
MHGPSSLLEVHEFLPLLPHHACGDVVGTESIAELSPRHLVIRGGQRGRRGVSAQWGSAESLMSGARLVVGEGGRRERRGAHVVRPGKDRWAEPG